MDGLQPLLEFKGRVDGYHTRVEIWPDQIRWERKAEGTVAKLLRISANLGSGSLPLPVRGQRRNGPKAMHTLPVSAIRGITTDRQGHSMAIRLSTDDGVLELDVSGGDADGIEATISNLIHKGRSAAP